MKSNAFTWQRHIMAYSSKRPPCNHILWRLHVLKCQALQFENMIYLSSWFLTFASNSPSLAHFTDAPTCIRIWSFRLCLWWKINARPVVRTILLIIQSWKISPDSLWQDWIGELGKKRTYLPTICKSLWLIVDPWQVGRCPDRESGCWPIIIRKNAVLPPPLSKKTLTID